VTALTLLVTALASTAAAQEPPPGPPPPGGDPYAQGGDPYGPAPCDPAYGPCEPAFGPEGQGYPICDPNAGPEQGPCEPGPNQGYEPPKGPRPGPGYGQPRGPRPGPGMGPRGQRPGYGPGPEGNHGPGLPPHMLKKTFKISVDLEDADGLTFSASLNTILKGAPKAVREFMSQETEGETFDVLASGAKCFRAGAKISCGELVTLIGNSADAVTAVVLGKLNDSEDEGVSFTAKKIVVR
jgi:hypothetical protein